MERLKLDLGEVKFAADDGKTGTFSGYGAVFGNRDSYDDVIEKGAFRDTLREWSEKGKFPPMLLQHGGGFLGSADDMLPVGVWTSMEENSKGLKVEGQLFALNTERGQYIYEGLKAGALDGMSIGFRTKKYRLGTKAGEARRYLEAVDLVELSIVTFPANDKARVGSVKSADIDALNTLSDAEVFLREAGGFSRKTALEFVSAFKRIALREAGSEKSLSQLLEQVRSTRTLIIP